jgi:hypothetical protein
MILTFDDIEEILGGPRIAQVGIGEMEKSRHLFEELQVNWLFSPAGWPVYASGSNPGIPESEQIFQFDVNHKRMQFANSTGRSSMTYSEMVELISAARTPEISLAALPVEQGDSDPTSTKSGKTKRRLNRQTQSLDGCIAAIQRSEGKCKFVVSQLQSFPADCHEKIYKKRFVQIGHSSDLESVLRQIKQYLEADDVDVIETDFPFLAAKMGMLFNSEFQLEDLTQSEFFSNNDPVFTSNEDLPRLVREAGLHTKSYIHHLFRCDELSGPIMLACINLYQLDKLFRKYVR